METKAFSLREVLRTAEHSARGVMSLKGHAIDFITPSTDAEGSGPMDGIADGIMGDPTRLLQVLNNLLSNGIKFTESGSVEYGVKHKGEMLEFFVTDTGVGIPAEERADIFKPFRQAHASVTTSQETLGGTGLGLSIAMRLVEGMGGELSFESSTDPVRHGTTFRFTIPYVKAKLRDDEEKMSDGDRMRSENATPMKMISGRVLLVDDNLVNLKLCKRFLSKMGCTTETARNGVEAEAKYFSDCESFDIILMDKEMPGMDFVFAVPLVSLQNSAVLISTTFPKHFSRENSCSLFSLAVMDGLECVRKIRTIEANELRPRIPIIALTAAAMTGDREECIAAGCDDHITKPLNRMELNHVLGKFLPTLVKE